MENIIDNEIGIIGTGFVGKALKGAFDEWGINGIETFDIAKESSCESLEEIVVKRKYLFICLPTPTEDNCPNFNIVRDACIEINLYCKEKGLERTILIKSTTLPSVIREIADICTDVKIVANPEFLIQRQALEDSLHPARVVYGCDDKDYAHRMSTLFSYPFLKDKTKYFITDLEQAMKIKYAANAFGAYKVLFFNIINGWCKDHEEYAIVREAVCASEWINPMHTYVPFGNSYGFGGACFPKDMLAFTKELKDCGFEDESNYLTKCLEINKKIREERNDIKL